MKRKTIKFGKIKFRFYRTGKFDSCSRCSYSSNCADLPDPKHPEDKTRNFSNFCLVYGGLSYPMPGTIEEGLKSL